MSRPTLLANHDAKSLVAFGQGGSKTKTDLLRDAAAISAALPEVTESSQVLLVIQHDRYAMAAALLGATHKGHKVALPPNTRRQSVWAVQQQPETVATLHDTLAGIPHKIEDLLATSDDHAALDLHHLGPFRVKLFSSGSTGSMQAWEKTQEQLLGEANLLFEYFGVSAGTKVVATVLPTHIYGLLFTVLMPMQSGAAFSRTTHLHAETVAQQIAESAAEVLVTVPIHLRALSNVSKTSLQTIKRVFCSTGPLSQRVAQAFLDQHGIEITEILGSTETGGFASRHWPSQEHWHPFPNVRVKVDPEQRLLIDSPFTDANSPKPFRAFDLAQQNPNGTFSYLGRSDGIVKVAGRRVSLQEMEDRLRFDPQVKDAAVTSIAEEQGRGHRIIAAVVAPTLSIPQIRQLLAERFEASSLPKRIIQVEELPRENNGKLNRQRLLWLFGLRLDGRPIEWRTHWETNRYESDEQNDNYLHEVTIPNDFGWFEGHFPGYPILAGAVQLKELVLPAVRRSFTELGDVKCMKKIKFTGRIVPGDQVLIKLARRHKTNVVSFEITKSGKSCSGGSLTFAQRSVAGGGTL